MNKTISIKPFSIEIMKKIKSYHFLYFVSVATNHPAGRDRDMIILTPYKDIFEAKKRIQERYDIFELMGINQSQFEIELISIHDFKRKKNMDYRVALNSDFDKNEESYPLLGLN